MPPSSSDFDRLAAQLDYPMVIVTAAARGERSGCLVGFTTQCSIHPPRYLVCISKLNHTYEVADRAEALGVHFPADGPEDVALAELFGEETGDEVDKFERCSWHPAFDGVTPLLDGIGRWFLGRVVEHFDAGDHVAYLLDPVQARSDGPERPGRPRQLGFQAVKDMPPGHPA